MAILWLEDPNFPSVRTNLYERLIDYLLDGRDRSRNITPLLPAEQAKKVLGPLCLWMQEKRRAQEITKVEFEERIAPLLKEIKPGLRAGDFISSLRDRDGLLKEIGKDSYIFLHNSFREFLAARELAEQVFRNPMRINLLVENFHDDWWRETLLLALTLDRPSIFAEFLERFLPHEQNAKSFPALLAQVIKESPHKPIEPFERFMFDRRQHWQKRYNALLCLRLIASEPAKALVQRVWEQEKHPRIKQKAEEILIEWKLHRPPIAPEMISAMVTS